MSTYAQQAIIAHVKDDKLMKKVVRSDGKNHHAAQCLLVPQRWRGLITSIFFRAHFSMSQSQTLKQFLQKRAYAYQHSSSSMYYTQAQTEIKNKIRSYT